jgi:hypothetical protein
MKKILIYTKNHSSSLGILDIISIIKKDLRLNKIQEKQISVGKELDSNYSTIIFIEKFNNIFNLIKIIFFLRKFKGKKIMVVTEFITTFQSSYKLKTFNYFGKNINYFYVSFYPLISFLYLLILLIVKITRIAKDYLKTLIQSFYKYKPIYLLYLIENKFFKKIKIISFDVFFKLDEFIYFYFRYWTFIVLTKFIKFDFYLCTHPGIKKDDFFRNEKVYELPMIYNSINFKKKHDFYLEFSGLLTKERFNFLKKINFNKKIYKKNNFDSLSELSVGKFIQKDKSKLNFNRVSLDIPKYKFWPYMSPTRYFNSLSQGILPITGGNFSADKSDLKKIIPTFYKFLRINKKKIFLITEKINKKLNNYNKKNIFILRKINFL